MKEPLDRTKVVLRHLPASIPHSMIMEQIDRVFDGRYNWSRFRPGKNSHKHQTHSRLYINFKRGEDVIEFAEFFNGHVFVNEKGNQFKVQVEYAPSQQVPKPPKKDGREGTISKDPEYIEFLENLSKPVENLPSAEIQLERREAERVGAPKDAPIVTPLMDFIRQKRAAKNWPQKSTSGKVGRRSGAASAVVSNSSSSRRGSEKKKSSTMYVKRDSAKNIKGNVKSNFILVTKKDDQRLLETSSAVSAAGKSSESDSGSAGANAPGTKKIVLLKGKGKETEISDVASNPPQQQVPVRSANTSYSGKNNQRREGGSGRIVRTVLSNSGARPFPSSSGGSEQVMQSSFVDKDKRSCRGSSVQLPPKDANGLEDKVSGTSEYGHGSEKFEKRTRNRDRPDRGVWAPLYRSDGSHASSESLSSTSQTAQSALDSSEGTQKQFGRRLPHGAKDAEGNPYTSEGKPSKRGPPGYGSSEKRIWIQKSGSGT